MADTPAKLQATYDALVEGFVLPLLEGTDVQLARPVGPGCAAFFTHATPTSEDARQRVFSALMRGGDEIAGLDSVPFPGLPILALAAAAHNLVAVTDPGLDRVLARGARTTILAWTDRWLELVPAPATRGDAVSRYVLLEPFLAVRRTDTIVKNWAYTYRFFGRRVPANVTALPTIRFVKTFESVTALRGELGRSEASLALDGRLRTLISRSPITELLRADEIASTGAFRFGLALLSCLADDALRSGLSRKVAEREAALSPFIGAALSAPELAREPVLLGVALRFVLELHLVLALDVLSLDVPALDVPALGSTNAMRSDTPLDGGAALVAAVLLAALEKESALRVVRVLHDDDRIALQARAESLRRAVPSQALEAATTLVDRAWPSA